MRTRTRPSNLYKLKKAPPSPYGRGLNYLYSQGIDSGSANTDNGTANQRVVAD